MNAADDETAGKQNAQMEISRLEQKGVMTTTGDCITAEENRAEVPEEEMEVAESHLQDNRGRVLFNCMIRILCHHFSERCGQVKMCFNF